ncbi:hypothetical protein R1sor_005315 [Riccia sorocarpa]|uniref:DUF4246 domain-containing protein n=1 Tax=Riccia sorocarpa TaxID=122646 RepID=A0ABD3HMQ4_9MARC
MAGESGSNEGLKRAIRSKPQWEEKVFDESISKKYILEAKEQGLSADLVDTALGKLREEASYILRGRSAHGGYLTLAATIQTGEGIEEPLEEKGNGVLDGIVPPQLRDLLETGLDAIANSPNKDFHPNTNDQVQDLIHSSLFPYIEGLSPLLVDPSLLPEKPRISYWNRQFEDSTYQWLPAEFFVDEKGTVKIETYINNLDEKQHEHLYRGIELLFQIFRTIIQPKGHVYEGTWHVEGMSHECIVASGIYYYSTSSYLKDSGLEFRRERNEYKDYPSIAEYHWSMQERMGDQFPNLHGLTMNVHLGTVPTVEDRLIVFSNDLQHKVSRIENTSQDQVGTRKILVFFLVDPDEEIVSTRHVPPQQWERSVPQLVNLMCLVVKRVTGKFFPLPLVQEIMSRAKSGLTLAEARRHRLGLMRERKYKIDSENEEWEREFTLCEH